MTTDRNTIASGSRHVEETEHLAAGLSEPHDNSPAPRHDETAQESTPEHRADGVPFQTGLDDLQLSMFAQGAAVRVRVGNPRNASELYEEAYESAEAANQAMLDGGILKPEQVPDITMPAGTGVALAGLTAEQLVDAGLKRHGTATYGGRQ